MLHCWYATNQMQNYDSPGSEQQPEELQLTQIFAFKQPEAAAHIMIHDNHLAAKWVGTQDLITALCICKSATGSANGKQPCPGDGSQQRNAGTDTMLEYK
jgi:hypothetical protein